MVEKNDSELILGSRKMKSKTVQSSGTIKNVKLIIFNFIKRTDASSYEKLICEIKKSEINDKDFQQLLSDIRENIFLLDRNLYHLVQALLSLEWYKRGNSASQEYQSFLIDLLSAHNYYVNFALEKLVYSFQKGCKEMFWKNGTPDSEEESWFQKIHDVLRVLLRVVPMSCKILFQTLTSQFPYFKRSLYIHRAYVYNLLKITEYHPDLRLDILLLIVNRVICLDLNAPKTEIEDHECQYEEGSKPEPEIFSMDQSEEKDESDEMIHPIANTLDAVLDLLFKFMYSVCHHEDKSLDWEATKGLYHEMIVVFERVILPTHNTYHVQFIMYYLCSFKVTIAEAFLNFLWRKVSLLEEAPVIRQTAAVYIASFLARATFIPLSILKDTVSKTAAWIHSYITNQDGLESTNSDIRVHSVFFSICQALFYVVAFRHGDLVNTRKNLAFLQSLNLTKMVTCRLNPLKVCIPPVVQNFAAVTRTYQLAYCYTVIEHNTRNIMPIIYADCSGLKSVVSNEFLDSFFPFDPILLRRCSEKITPIYREYQGAAGTSAAPEPKHASNYMEEEDDFLIEQPQSTSSAVMSDLFSYSSSPGFKKHM